MEEERNQWEGRPFRLLSFDRLSPMQRIYTYDETKLNDEGDDTVTKPLRMCTQEMDVIEVDDELAIKTCKLYNYKYAVVTPDDIVIPPKNVSISQD